VRLHDIPRVEEVQRRLTELLGGGTGLQTVDRQDDDGT
jgi:hypothetical protein